jgi:hypothetical protein
MHSWINLTALWKIVVFGLVAGAGLPALFAIGLRVLNPPPRVAVSGAANGQPTQAQSKAQAETTGVTAGALGIAAAVLCFAVVLSAIGWGIDFIVSQS